MKRGSKLKARLPKVCVKCGSNFLGKQHNSKKCDTCKMEENKLIPCKCGCGKLVKAGLSGYYMGCKFRGKTYKEIYGTDNPGCGFAKGKQNPNYTTTRFRGKRYINKNNEYYRSSLEVLFSEFLIDNGYSYEYEKIFHMNNSKYKIVDFVVNDIIVEVTGFAYKGWQTDFINKMKNLRKSVDNQIIVVTYPEHLMSSSRLYDLKDIDVWFDSVYNLEGIKAKIDLYTLMQKINKKILSYEK